MRLRSSAPFISGWPPHSAIITSSFALHIVVMPGYVGGRKADVVDGLGCYNTSGSPSPPSPLLFNYTTLLLALLSRGHIFCPQRRDRFSPASEWSPGAEIVRILAPIFSEQIALVRSTILFYRAVPGVICQRRTQANIWGIATL